MPNRGEIEAKAEEENRRLGIVVSPAVLKQLKRLNDEVKLGFEFLEKLPGQMQLGYRHIFLLPTIILGRSD